jgi:CRP-like cAMP-binding protein
MFAAVQTPNRQSPPASWHRAIGTTPIADTRPMPEPLDAQDTIVQGDRDEAIIAQDDPAGNRYLIVSGCVRTVKVMEDGRRQIGLFLFPGDLFGWEGLDEHDFAAEAVTPVTLCRYPRHNLEARADRDPDFGRRLRGISDCQLRAGREGLVLLLRKTPSERIASFLLEAAGCEAVH